MLPTFIFVVPTSFAVGLHYPNSNAVTFTVMLVVLLAPVVASLVAFIWGADIRRAGEAGVLPHNPI